MRRESAIVGVDRLPDGVRLAITTLTVLPARPARVDRRTAAQAMLLTPAVGLVVGVATALVLFAMRHVAPYQLPYNAAVVTVIFLVLATRGIHLDGLADTADGLACLGDPERRLAAMRDPGVGALGVTAVVLALLADTTAISLCVNFEHGTASVVSSIVAGRVAIVLGARRGVPAARPDGLGAAVAGTVPAPVWVSWCVAAVVGTSMFGAWHDHERAAVLWRGGLAVAMGLAVAELLRWVCVRRFGGITGDVLGAMAETATAVCLIVFSTIPNP